jgi:WXG100 family type VII secretion target
MYSNRGDEMDELKVKSGDVLASCTLVKEAAEMMSGAAISADHIAEELENIWQGPAATLYVEKCRALSQDIRKVKNELDEIVEKLKSTAGKVEQMEAQLKQSMNT